jgi:predicted RNase H-like nuclease (RuvC/YqgF family)
VCLLAFIQKVTFMAFLNQEVEKSKSQVVKAQKKVTAARARIEESKVSNIIKSVIAPLTCPFQDTVAKKQEEEAAQRKRVDTLATEGRPLMQRSEQLHQELAVARKSLQDLKSQGLQMQNDIDQHQRTSDEIDRRIKEESKKLQNDHAYVIGGCV